ncbi:MAG TPA: hypothetical protein VL405_02605 [Sphingomonas sp.]|jgi:uncharacterized phiE125 gp8 family phage protein|nr:hypothetical protein [Sphingomonas sp.]
MIESDAYAVPAAAVDDARVFCRIDGNGEDAVLTELIAAGLAACEAFTGVPPVARGYRERFGMRGGWVVLSRYPVRAITGVSAVDDGAVGPVLAGTAYEADIDTCDRGRVRVIVPPGAPGIEVAYRAGLASEWASCPGSLRFGVLHFVAAAMAARDGRDLPERATALWRPYRAMRLA